MTQPFPAENGATELRGIPRLPRRFAGLDVSRAPGQQGPRADSSCVDPVDFSHGDVDAFEPLPAAVDAVNAAARAGGSWAYSPYRGHAEVRRTVAARLARMTRSEVDADREVLVSAGTQASLFLAMSSVIESGDKVAIVSPDYFAYRRITEYLEARPVEIPLSYRDAERPGELDLNALERALRHGSRVVVLSNPNNPTGVVFSRSHLSRVNALVAEYDGLLIVDQLYCRQIFDNRTYTHFRELDGAPSRTVTLLGPSKTESLSGLRLGVALGPSTVIDRMEALQGLVTLRAPGYSQRALNVWLDEPAEWMSARVAAHQAIRDDIMGVIQASPAAWARRTEGGSYLFLHVPPAAGRLAELVSRLRCEAGVIVTVGTEFGDHHDAVRLNFSQHHRSAVAAVERLTDLVERF